MRAIAELQQLGYTFTLDGDTIRYRHVGRRPDPEQVRPLLQYLRRHREQALGFMLKQRVAASAKEDGILRLATTPMSEATGRPWVGQRIKLEELPDFKRRWRLRAVGSEWRMGEPCPRVYLVEE